MSETPTGPTPGPTETDGRTPSAPDVDQPDGGSGGSSTPATPDVDQPEGGSP